MRAIRAWTRDGLPRQPLAWLLTSAHHAVVSYYRRTRPIVVDPETVDLAAPAFTPDSPDTAAIVNWALTRVRRAHADVIEAFYFDGKPVKQIAAEQQTSERAVEGRLRRARLKLKRVLDRARQKTSAASSDAARRSIEHG
jgi:DNA-directed RNA polymerase specialized sigma24 family protein